MVTLSSQQARQTYDRIGSLQDSQRFYEDRATALVLEHGNFSSAGSVFEFGFGTGRFALHLLEQHLPEAARYRGVDLSPEMFRLASSRLVAHSARVELLLSEGQAPVNEPTSSCDRFVSNYVFDLLSHTDIRAVLLEAHRILSPGGLLCLSGLADGSGTTSRLVPAVLRWIHTHWPTLVGGCRPIDLLPFLQESHWQLQYHSKVVSFGVPSQVIVAQRRPQGR